jgi:hypothetical protein
MRQQEEGLWEVSEGYLDESQTKHKGAPGPGSGTPLLLSLAEKSPPEGLV